MNAGGWGEGMGPWIPTLTAVLVVSAISLVGALAGSRLLRSHAAIMALVAVAAGALLGDAFLHLLPESAEEWGGFDVRISGLVLAGFFLFFVLEVVLRLGHAHGEVLEHEHGHSHGAGDGHQHVAPFGWMNLAGDAVHNFLDGAVLAASYTVDVGLGFATTIAVVLHEIPQELGDFAVLLKSGMSRRKALLFNFLTALTSVAGAVLFLVLPFPLASLQKVALPLTAGGFLYIAAADLVPELHHHAGERHARAILVGVAVGVGAMAALLALE